MLRWAIALTIGIASADASAGSAELPMCALPREFPAEGRLTFQDGQTIPTNAFLFHGMGEPLPAWQARVRKDDGFDEGVLVEGGGKRLFDGRLDLDPDTSYVIDLWNGDDDRSDAPRMSVSVLSDAGADEAAPDKPKLDEEPFVSEVLPAAAYEGECGGTVPAREAATSAEWEIDAEPGSYVLLFDPEESLDEAASLNREAWRNPPDDSTTTVEVRTADPGERIFFVASFDIANNRSETLVVKADFGGCGACAAGGDPSPVAAVFLMLFRYFTRGGRPRGRLGSVVLGEAQNHRDVSRGRPPILRRLVACLHRDA